MKSKKSPLKIIGKIILIILIIIVVAIGALGGYIYFYAKTQMGRINYVDIDLGDIEVNEGVSAQLKGFRNIALFGLDSREDDYGVGNRSDCIMIASINNATKNVKLVSVYRDSYLDRNGTLDKVNHAYSYGGPTLAINTLNRNLDLNITEFVTVNWYSLINIIDSVGGIQITIEPEEVKYINDYIKSTAAETGKSGQTINSAGTYNLSGIQAVAYSRIRYTAGGDYKRTERMRTVLEKILQKAKTKDIFELKKIAEDILPEISTNIQQNEIISLLPQLPSFSIGTSIGWPYEVKGITLDRWYGVPVNLEANVKKLHQEVFEEANYEPSETVKSISNAIIKKTGYK